MERCRCCPGVCRKPRKKRGGKKKKASKKPQEIIITLREPSVRSVSRIAPPYTSSLISESRALTERPTPRRQTIETQTETETPTPRAQTPRPQTETETPTPRAQTPRALTPRLSPQMIGAQRGEDEEPLRRPIGISPRPSLQLAVESGIDVDTDPNRVRFTAREIIARRRMLSEIEARKMLNKRSIETQTITTAGRPSGAEKAEYDANKEPGETYADYRIRTRDQTLGVFNVKSK